MCLPVRCRPTTMRCCAANWACSPSGACSASSAVTWSDAEQQAWQRVCDLLVASALAQPVVAVHRDWMPRNLMVADPNPGILDFQDAAAGPIAYDMASLLRDAFLSWDEEREIDWAVRYWEAARRATLPVADDFGEFWRQLEWIGPAAPPEGAGHLLPPEAPRRQGQVQPKTCRASSPMRPRWRRATASCSRCWRCSSRCRG